MSITITLTALLSAYAEGVSEIKQMMAVSGKERLRINYDHGPRCFNVHIRTGEAEPVTELVLHPEPDGLTAIGETGTEYPLGDDYDGQDNYVLSDLFALVRAVDRTLLGQPEKNG